MFKPSVRAFLIALLSLIIAMVVIDDTRSAQAQLESDSLEIGYTLLNQIPDQDGIQLQIFFTPNAAGKPVRDAQFSGQQLTLSDYTGGPIQVTVEPAQGAVSLVLILDASGSMGSVLPSMKKAVQGLIDGLPDDTTFTIYQFNQSVVQLLDFSKDKQAAKNAVDAIKAPNLAPTCLYDAALTGIEKAQSGIRGRRAVVLFTDGRDEKGDRSKTPCSRVVLDEVIAKATSRDSRVPVYTVGLQDKKPGAAPIAEAELRSLAQATGGAFAIGDNVETIFAEIKTAIDAQRVATAQIFPAQGEKVATLNVTTQGGKVLTASTTFFSPRDYTPKATPVAVNLTIDSVQFDRAGGRIVVDASVLPNDSGIKEYEFRVSHESGELLARYTVPKPLPNPLTYPLFKMMDGKLIVELRATTLDNQVIIATREVSYLSPTQAPVTALLTAVAYDAATDTVSLRMQYQGKDQIQSLTFNIVDSATNTLVQSIQQPGALDEIKFVGRTVGLKRDQKYAIEVILQTKSGIVGGLAPREFTYQPPAVSGATAVPVTIVVEPVQLDRVANQLNLTIRVQNEAEVVSYDLLFVNTERSERIAEFTFPAPLPIPLLIPLDRLQDGKIQLTVSAQRKNGTTETKTFDFAILTPTAVAVLINSTITSIIYNPDTDVVELSLLYNGRELIRGLKVTLTDAASGTTVGNFDKTPDETISFSAANYRLEAGKTYRVTIIPVNATRAMTEAEITREFIYSPKASASTTMQFKVDETNDTLILTPQFSNPAAVDSLDIEFINKAGVRQKQILVAQLQQTITFSIADLPDGEYTLRVIARNAGGSELTTWEQPYVRAAPAPQLTITSAEANTERQIAIQLQVTNPQQIALYRVSLQNANGLMLQTETIAAPPYDRLQFNTKSNIAGGEYSLLIEGMNANNQPVVQVNRKFQLPELPGLPQQIILSMQRNPLPWSLVIVAVIAVGLVLIVRSRKAPDPFEKQGRALQPAAIRNPQINIGSGRSKPNLQLPDDFRTGAITLSPVVIPQLSDGPHFVLDDERSRIDLPLSDRPFTIGRRDADFIIAHDTVSRNHLVITYEREALIGTDNSSNGTLWRYDDTDPDEKLLKKGEHITLRHGMILRIGIIVLLFQWPNQPTLGAGDDTNLKTVMLTKKNRP